jgi:hypothetical protein
MEELKKELSCIHIDDMDAQTKDEIIKLYAAIVAAKGNIIEVCDTHNEKLSYDSDLKKSIQVFDSDNLYLVLENKINHILLHNCSNITLVVSNGCISGIDVLNSENVTIIFKKYQNYQIELSHSCEIKIFIEKELLEFLVIMALYTLNCKLFTFDVNDANENDFMNNIVIRHKVNLLSPLVDNIFVYTMQDNCLYGIDRYHNNRLITTIK